MAKMTRAEIAQFYGRLRKANPEPKGELLYLNPFTLLVAVVLSEIGRASCRERV